MIVVFVREGRDSGIGSGRVIVAVVKVVVVRDIYLYGEVSRHVCCLLAIVASWHGFFQLPLQGCGASLLLCKLCAKSFDRWRLMAVP